MASCLCAKDMIGGRQMISSEVEDRIARYFFHQYLPEDVRLEIVGTLLPFYLIDDDEDEPSADEMVKLYKLS